ncbi:MAG: hypothetical protein AABZ60_03165, partial [Planctomycetota bacterium]
MKSFFKKILRKKVIFSILLVFLTVGLIFSGLNYIATDRMDRALMSIRSFKDPVRWQEVVPPLIPSIQNAYSSYKKAMTFLPDVDENLEMMEHLSNFHFMDKAKFNLGESEKAFLNQHPDVFRFMEESLQRSDCQYPINYSEGFSTELPHLEEIRTLLQFSLLQTSNLASEKQYLKAEQLLKASLKLARSIENEPFIISYLYEISMYTSVLEMSLGLYQYYPEMRSSIRNLFQERPDWKQLLVQKIKYERSMAIGSYLDIIRGEYPFYQITKAFGNSDFYYTTYIPQFFTVPFIKLDMVYLLEEYKQFIDHCQMNSWYALKNINESRRQSDTPFYAILSKMIVGPSFSGMYTRQLQAISIEELFLISLEVIDFMTIHKKFPEDIQSLSKTAKIPFLDPFTGSPYSQI